VKGTSVESEAVDGPIPCEMNGEVISNPSEVSEVVLLLTSSLTLR
jgi:hypothetical protein